MGFTVAQIQPTPNPNAVKFILDRPISQQPASYFDSSGIRYPQSAQVQRLRGGLLGIYGFMRPGRGAVAWSVPQGAHP